MLRKIYDLLRRAIPRPIRPALRAPGEIRPGHSQFSCLVIGEGALTVQCSDILISRGHEVTAIVTSNPEIIQWARERSVRLLDPAEDVVAAFKGRAFDYLFSIANMRMLSKETVALPQRSTINFHDGPLPRYAGVHATSWALIHNERSHAVSWHEISDLVDGGRILKQQSVPIANDETAYSLNTKCFEAGMQSFAELVGSLTAAPGGTVTAIEADHNQVATGAGSLRIHQLLTLDATPLPRRHAIQQFGLTLGTRLPGLDVPLRQRISTFPTRICRH